MSNRFEILSNPTFSLDSGMFMVQHLIGRRAMLLYYFIFQDMSDGIDKSWDHPWTTEEMRKKRREWSLAGDVGLLKHLQQFSEV